MRKKLIAGNWKMNNDLNSSIELAKSISTGIKKDFLNNTDILICPTFISISKVYDSVKDSGIYVGAQNMHFKDDGAFTGEISAEMLISAGCEYVILGHSERRQLFHETDHLINLKLKKALKSGLIPILCVGETLEQREEGIHEKIVDEQITFCLKEVSKEDISKVVIAYEPVWAIGTGKTASPEQANQMHKKIRDSIANLYGDDFAQNIRILYGGSVNDKNASELFSQPDIDGGLIGGASLKSQQFLTIIENATK